MAAVLAKLPVSDDPRVLVSAGTADDAGVYQVEGGPALVQTVDFFPPMVDDPRDFGRIAAANAVSDVYAMGATPLTALNIVCFPSCKMPTDTLAEILLGGLDTMNEAGVAIIGGHSVDDDELKYGLAVTGIVDPTRIVTNAGAAPGELLVLTKPLGVGILTTAIKNDRLTDDEIDSVTALMSKLNRTASEAMLEAGASAATDVTGFGLIGHAREMALASDVTLEIDAEGVPIIANVESLYAAKVAARGLYNNHSFYCSSVKQESSANDNRTMVFYDPQTSGGLLIALGGDRLESFRAAMRERGDSDFWVIGRAVPKGPFPIVLR